jgi:hypothetical protein
VLPIIWKRIFLNFGRTAICAGRSGMDRSTDLVGRRWRNSAMSGAVPAPPRWSVGELDLSREPGKSPRDSAAGSGGAPLGQAHFADSGDWRLAAVVAWRQIYTLARNTLAAVAANADSEYRPAFRLATYSHPKNSILVNARMGHSRNYAINTARSEEPPGVMIGRMISAFGAMMLLVPG